MPGQGLPILLATKGNPNFRSERLVQLEVGHRIRLGTTASLETTVFSGSYDDLSTSEPFQPTVELTPAPPHVLAGAMLENMHHCARQRRRAQRSLESAAALGDRNLLFPTSPDGQIRIRPACDALAAISGRERARNISGRPGQRSLCDRECRGRRVDLAGGKTHVNSRSLRTRGWTPRPSSD